MGRLLRGAGWLIIAAVAVAVLAPDDKGEKRDKRPNTSDTNVVAPAEPPYPPAPQPAPAPIPVALPRSDPPPSMREPGPPPKLVVPVPKPAPVTYYTTTRARLRIGPSTDTRALTTIAAREPVRVIGSDGRWLSVEYGHHRGWIRNDLLTVTVPVAKPLPSPAPLARIPARSSPEAGSPARDPLVGRCDCPYDLMRNGRRCGGRSAYSRPGGRSPVCYH